MQAYSRKQAEVLLNANSRWNFLIGATRSGKTFVSYDLLLKRMLRQPPGRAVLIGKTIGTLERNVLEPMRERFGIEYVSHIMQERGALVVHLFGRKCYVLGANDAKAATKLQGMGLVYAYGDEVPTWHPDVFTQLKARLSEPGAMFDGTGNPEGPNHWLKKDFLDKEGLNLYYQHFTLDDNPFLPPEFVESLKTEYAGTVWYGRYILGEWIGAEGMVYDMFDADRHVVDHMPNLPIRAWLVPIDYATGNPTAFLKLAVVYDPQEKREKVYVVDEYYWDSQAKGKQKTDVEYSADLKTFIDGITPIIYVDPSAASLKAQFKKDRIYGVKDADNSVLDGIRLVASFLASGRLFIVKGRAPNLLKEFAAYVWDSKAQAKGKDEPLKQNDHALDALRYGLYTYFRRDGQARLPVTKHPAW